MTKIFAHRGSSGTHPENTMEAFKEAYRTGCDGIELDIQLTKDGQLAVIHDDTLNRTTDGQGPVRAFTMKELAQFNAGYTHKSRIIARIPSIDEVFSWLQTNHLLCNVELKNKKVKQPHMEELLLQKIAQYDLQSRMILSTFSLPSLAKLHALAPETEKAPLYSRKGVNPLLLAKTIKAQAIHAHYDAITVDQMKHCQRHHVPVRLYTVNKEKHLIKWLNAGVAGVMTDFPEKAVAMRRTLQTGT